MGEGKALRSILAHERRVVTERTRSRVQPTKNDFLRKRVAGVRGEEPGVVEVASHLGRGLGGDPGLRGEVISPHRPGDDLGIT